MKKFSLERSFGKNPLFTLSLLCFIFIFNSCEDIKNSVFDDRIEEGTILYEINFPSLDEESLTATLLPEEMSYCFKEGEIITELETMGGVFKNKIISNSENRNIFHELKVFRKKIKVEMNMDDIGLMLSTFPAMTIIHTDQTDSIAGFLCKKAIAVYDEVGIKETVIWYTDEIKIKNPNWFNQYYDISGVLMDYEVEQFGVKMHFRAKEVINQPVEKSIFKPEEDYKNITMEMMQIELAQLKETFDF